MNRILILYHSGAGSAKFVAKEMARVLEEESIPASLCSIEEPEAVQLTKAHDRLIIGFPVYHATPSASITAFIEKLPRFSRRKNVFAYTTYGLYSANTLRIFAKQCLRKNLITVHTAGYRSPASDGSLILPGMKFWFRFQRDIHRKISRDLDMAVPLLKQPNSPFRVPRFKVYRVLNYPNKMGGLHLFNPRIRLSRDLCIRCGKCITNCPWNCFSPDSERWPKYEGEHCEHCYRCIHHCPTKALSMGRKVHRGTLLSENFFDRYNDDAGK